MRDITVNLQNSDLWKISLTIAINFISSKDVDEEHAMHSKSDNIEFISYGNANELLMDFSSQFFQDSKLV